MLFNVQPALRNVRCVLVYACIVLRSKSSAVRPLVLTLVCFDAYLVVCARVG